MKEASHASRSFSEGHKRLNGLEIGVILLFICGFFLSLSVINFVIGLLRNGNLIWSLLGVVLLSIGFITIIWGMRKIHKQGYIFDPPVVYSRVYRKHVDLQSNPRQLIFNEGNNRLYISTKNSIIVFDDTINKIVNELAIKNTGYIAVDHLKDILFVTLERGIAVIDTSSNTLIKNIFEEFRFGQLCINFNTNMLYAINLDFHCVYIIECSSQTLIDKIYCDGYPRAVTVNPNTNSIYIANSDFIVTKIDGSKNQLTSRIHLRKLSGYLTAHIDELYVDPLNNILYINEHATGPAGEGGVGLHTSFFGIHLNEIDYQDYHDYFIHDFECNIIPKTERYTTNHTSESTLHKHDIFWKHGSLDNSFVVSSKSGLVYLTDLWEKRIDEIDAHNKILRTFAINHNYVSMSMSPNGNKLYLTNSGYFSNSLDIIYLQKEPTVNPPLSIENSNH